jgi:hypothetical protein
MYIIYLYIIIYICTYKIYIYYLNLSQCLVDPRFAGFLPPLTVANMATRPLPRYEKSHQTGSKFLGSPDWSRRLLHLGLGAFSDLKDPDALWCDHFLIHEKARKKGLLRRTLRRQGSLILFQITTCVAPPLFVALLPYLKSWDWRDWTRGLPREGGGAEPNQWCSWLFLAC